MSRFRQDFKPGADRWLSALAALLLVALPHRAPGQDRPSEISAILSQKCFQCHGERMQMSNLDLRTRAAMLRGGQKGPAIIPGNAGASALYKRIAGLDTPAMPLAPLPALSSAEILAVKKWIDQGAPWEDATPDRPATSSKTPAYGNEYQEKAISESDRQWWSFRKPVRYAAPQVGDARWNQNPIDAFVKKALDQKGLVPAPVADKNTLVRRAYLDLTGLLPTPAEVEAFVNDPSPHAYERLVDRLLDSPHYGERWARFWLDVARYADSSGYESDRDMANAWRYRDYVIKAFNEDKPYNQFIVEQLAGDELDSPTYDSLIATGFNRLGPRVRYREKDNPYYRYEYLDDMIRTTFQGFLGLSVNCARCHDHKFDPISRKDYYRSIAMLFGFVEYNHPLVPSDEAAQYQKAKTQADAQIVPLRRRIAQIEAPYAKAEFEKTLAKFPPEIQDAVHTPGEQRTPGQKLLAAQILSLNVNVDNDTPRRSSAKLNEADQATRQKLQAEINGILKTVPRPPPVAEGIRDGDFRFTPDGPGDEPLPGKGDRIDYGVTGKFLPELGDRYVVPPVYFGANGLSPYEEEVKAPVVEPGFLRVLTNGNPPTADPPNSGYVTSGRRRALAEWIASENNPLTARVMINRIWYQHFGQGLVSTPGNFGKMGTQPSHPELLDWLGTEFARQGWSIKRMQRLIMASETYRAASSFSQPSNLEKDPNDTYLWKFPLKRLEAEILRDITLSASGQLNLQAGGPPFFPSIPASLRAATRAGRWVVTKEEPSTWRRSVYSYWKRSLKYPLFEVFDQPDNNVTCEKRNVTTVPTQALTLMNNEFVLIQAGRLAERVKREAGDGLEAQVTRLYNIAFSRNPSTKELEGEVAFLKKQGEYHRAKSGADADLAALTDMADVVLNSNEFVYNN